LRLLTKQAKRLEDRGWRVWYAEMFGQSFVDALDGSETEDKHHSQAIEWHWRTRRALIAIELETNQLKKRLQIGVIAQKDFDAKMAGFEATRAELFLAYFTIWARGNLKTTIARRVAVADACLSASAGVSGYALVIGGTKRKVRKTANAIDALLTKPPDAKGKGSNVYKYYPKLARVKRNKMGMSKGWTTDYINTEADYSFEFVGLDEGMAGANEEDIRPTFMLPDDIDNRKDSPVIAENNFQVFTTEVLPMRQWNTLVFYAQNLISRFAVMYRIWKQHARVLTNRLLTNPIPAVRDLKCETRTVNGMVKDVYVSGKPTWRAWTPQRIQEEIDTMGLPAFLRECQHEVEEDKVGLVLQNYDDTVHPISKSEFASIYGTRECPHRWFKYVFNDWARTKTKFHANAFGVLAASGASSRKPTGIFLFNPMSFPAASSPEDVAIRFLKSIKPTVYKDGRTFSWDELRDYAVQKIGIERLIHDETKLIQYRRSALADIIPALVSPILTAQNYVSFKGSHEQNSKGKMTGVLEVYRRTFGLPFQPANPGFDGGVDDINIVMKVDHSKAHPFRPGQMGYTNFFVVVDDDESQTPRMVKGMAVYPPMPYNDALTPDDLHDADLFRYQAQNCRRRDPYLTAAGEREGEILRLNDDFIKGLMFVFKDGVPQPNPLTHAEMVEEMIPKGFDLDTLRRRPDLDSAQAEMSHAFARQQAEKRLKPRSVEADEWGQVFVDERY
jgi:hypothetical protein